VKPLTTSTTLSLTKPEDDILILTVKNFEVKFFVLWSEKFHALL